MNLEGIAISLQKDFLCEKLPGARIDKIYQPERLSLFFQLRNNNSNMFFYATCGNSPHIRITDKTPENPENPPSFCMLLRKHLENGRIMQIAQHKLDRIIIMDIDTLGKGKNIVTKQLVFELTGKSSNIIFLQDNIIIDCLKHIGPSVSRFRQLLPGREYMPPPQKEGFNILSAQALEIVHALPASAKSLSKSLIEQTLGIGPLTANEIAWRAGLPPDLPAANLDAKDSVALCEAIESIVLPIKNNAARSFVAVDNEGGLLAVAPFAPQHLPSGQVKEFATMNAAISFAIKLQPAKSPLNVTLSKQVRSEITRLEKKMDILSEETVAAQNADRLKETADNIMSQLYAIKKGEELCLVTDIFTGEQIEIKLDPLLTPVENAQRYYKLYNKAKRAVSQLQQQTRESSELLDYLMGVEFSLEEAKTSGEVLEIKNELLAAGILQEKTYRPLRTQISQPWKITLASGAIIYVGKNNRQNDQLTFKTAKAGDLWLHAKNIPGSHVILQNSSPDNQEGLFTAALLAAWFSKARRSSNIPVDYTFKKHVKKPAGARPGFVIYEQQKTIQVTTDEEKIKHILQ